MTTTARVVPSTVRVGKASSHIHSAETYTAERFFTDLGMMLVLLLTLALVIQLCVYTGS